MVEGVGGALQINPLLVQKGLGTPLDNTKLSRSFSYMTDEYKYDINNRLTLYFFVS